MNLSNVQSVCEKNIYLLDPSKDDVVLFRKFLKMMQYAKNDAIMVPTHNLVTEGRGLELTNLYRLNRGLPTYLFVL